MTIEHDVEKQELPNEQLADKNVTPENNEEILIDQKKPEEELYFWSEPGVCG